MSGYKSTAAETATAEAVTPEAQITNREVDAEQAKEAVLKYAEQKQKDGARQIATILKTADIRFSDNTITLTINNETQKEQFLLVRQHFVDYIRLELQNSGINIELLISTAESSLKAYKPMDIFKAMSEKNPALLDLKKRFDLEIDY